jgi:hypothetical protein
MPTDRSHSVNRGTPPDLRKRVEVRVYPHAYRSVRGTKSDTGSEDRRAHDRLDTPRHQLSSLVTNAGR